LHTINVNNNFSISIDFRDFNKSHASELYFDFVVWAKSAEAKLANVNGVMIFRQHGYAFPLWIYNNDNDTIVEYNFFYDAENNGMKIIKHTNVNADCIDDSDCDTTIVEKDFLAGTRNSTTTIFTILNTHFQVNGCHRKFETVELFVKNNNENIARCSFSGKIFSDFIYINKEELMKEIEKQPNFFIETIRINREDFKNIVDIDSMGCG